MSNKWYRLSQVGGLLTLFLAVFYLNGPLLTRADDTTFASPAFARVWAQTDKPIATGKATRSWMWGPAPFAQANEQYKESPNGSRLVQYFDKARMEINNPNTDPHDKYYVTNGLLVVELMTGRRQDGDNTFTQQTRGFDSIAGDTAAVNPDAPTYATFASRATLINNENQAQDCTGQPVNTYFSYVGSLPHGDAYGVTCAYYEPTLKHNIPDVFWHFMNAQGLVYDEATGNYTNGLIVDWQQAMGFPITEAYWAKVKVGGQDKLVLIQAFQRRVLTYTPSNAPEWRVEMGNVGMHYADWRKGLSCPKPNPGNLSALNILDCSTLALSKQSSFKTHTHSGYYFTTTGDCQYEKSGKLYCENIVRIRPAITTRKVEGITTKEGLKYQRIDNGKWEAVPDSTITTEDLSFENPLVKPHYINTNEVPITNFAYVDFGYNSPASPEIIVQAYFPEHHIEMFTVRKSDYMPVEKSETRIFDSLYHLYEDYNGPTYIPTPNPNTIPMVTSIDDSTVGTGLNQFNYSGSDWYHCTMCEENPPIGLYNQSQSWSPTKDNFVSLTFSGTQLDLYGVVDNHHGLAGVSIDGGKEATVDFKDYKRKGNVLLWVSPLLPQGTHTLKIRVIGTGGSGVIPIDRVDVISNTP